MAPGSGSAWDVTTGCWNASPPFGAKTSPLLAIASERRSLLPHHTLSLSGTDAAIASATANRVAMSGGTASSGIEHVILRGLGPAPS